MSAELDARAVGAEHARGDGGGRGKAEVAAAGVAAEAVRAAARVRRGERRRRELGGAAELEAALARLRVGLREVVDSEVDERLSEVRQSALRPLPATPPADGAEKQRSKTEFTRGIIVPPPSFPKLVGVKMEVLW